jgi:hypothetical protein
LTDGQNLNLSVVLADPKIDDDRRHEQDPIGTLSGFAFRPWSVREAALDRMDSVRDFITVRGIYPDVRQLPLALMLHRTSSIKGS